MSTQLEIERCNGLSYVIFWFVVDNHERGKYWNRVAGISSGNVDMGKQTTDGHCENNGIKKYVMCIRIFFYFLLRPRPPGTAKAKMPSGRLKKQCRTIPLIHRCMEEIDHKSWDRYTPSSFKPRERKLQTIGKKVVGDKEDGHWSGKRACYLLFGA